MYNNNSRYDSRYNSAKRAEIQEAVEFILDKKYGEVIPFEQLAKILKYNIADEKEKKKFKSIMGRIKNFLVDYGYVLKSIVNVGYYILKPKQISGYCYHTYIRRTAGLLEKSERILNHVDKTELSEDRKKEHKEVTQLNSDVYYNIGNTIFESEYEKNKCYYDNLSD